MSTVGWSSTERARTFFGGDAPLDDAVLESYLQVAYEQCVEYAPAVLPSPLPERFERAQLLQAKALWEADRSGSGDQIGPDGFAVRVFPLDWHVKQHLRPRRGVPVVG